MTTIRMGSSVHGMNKRGETDEERVLGLLDAVGRHNDVSQRRLAREMGVALGLANSYLKRCVRKGLIKVNSAPANRYLYYLTPKGFAEKSRLTAKYLSSSFAFYRRASESCARVLDECSRRRWRRVVLCGVSDLAEIAALRALETEIEVVAVFDPASDRSRLVTRPVWRSLPSASKYDGLVLTDVSAAPETYAQVMAVVGPDRVLVPDILGLH